MSQHEHSMVDYGTGKKSLPVYIYGIVFSIIFTLIPFYVVMQRSLSSNNYYLVIFTCAIIQFIVQTLCFLRLNAQTEQGKTNIMTFIFTLVILAVVIGGSIWIMYNLNYNMM